ncbi:MAG: PQQ-dependent sugar dehydrogenase [Bacteroidota bacterium]
MKKYILITGLLALLITAGVMLQGKARQYLGNMDASRNYQTYCASCHGEQLKSFVDRKWTYGKSWNTVFTGIKEGYPDGGMPAYGETFTDKEIAALVNYILTGIEKTTIKSFQSPTPPQGIIQTQDYKVRIDTVVGGIDVPWGIAFLPDGDMLVTDRQGDFYRFREGEPLHRIGNVPKVRAAGQGGLMDVEVHPQYAQNGFIYLSYSKPKGAENTTAVLRARLENDRLVDVKEIFEAQPYVSTRHHYGSRLEFDTAGYLYLSVGDRGRREDHPQYLTNACGKIHRIHDDGSIPEGNPFVDQPDAVRSIFSYGHRNPQGLAMNPESGEIWDNEHGPRGGDEINRIEKGKNYGWPVISYGINYNGSKFTDITAKEGMEQPVDYWVPSIGVCGMTFVSGDQFPNWKGDILSGSLRFNYIHRTIMEGNKVIGEEKLLPNIGRLRTVAMGPDGFVYIGKENPGYVLRLVPVP